ncbi:sugar-binding domain-containing protein [Actinomyces minihominis]|uniref:sugar-binding domain-containing protein n=1 Tax=Actinomyces minihominis TaxID=2002838 RepID=UPI000C06CE86|nr:sugar-binding domain-containing protein [Actinomyces minihominis]
MLTPWGEVLDASNPLPDYPRPQLVRKGWSSLNGPWDYAIQPLREERDNPLAVDDPADPPGVWDGKITVPFSPEMPLSGVNRTLQPSETLWYSRSFSVEPSSGERVLLHFGAIDQSCRVAVDGVEVGGNVGGYLPFTLDITDALVPGSFHSLVVAVRDVTNSSYLSVGKQSLNRGGIWYSPQSGIWQTVWLEVVPEQHIWKLRYTPSLDSVEVTVTATPSSSFDETVECATVEIGSPGLFEERDPSDWAAVQSVIISQELPVNEPVRVQVPEPKQWSPETPYLYPVRITLGSDVVTSYFALRTVGVGERADGQPALLLNGKPHFARGLLDQGYWPDGGYTPASDEALIYDIQLAKSAGYNMLRKHIKIEPLRWYHHCDRLGMLVWQDAVNGGRPPRKILLNSRVVIPFWIRDRPGAVLGRQDPEGLSMFASELADMIDTLHSVPSVVMWVPFNEGWGQFDAALVAQMVRELDPTRTIDHASGWFDQGAGDLNSTHVYLRPPTRVGLTKPRGDRRVLALTEYGGLGLPIPNHQWNESTFGYLNYKSPEALAEAFRKLHAEQLPKVVARGLGATVYTQLSDVEDEVNGLVTYDRKVVKIPLELVRDLNRGLGAAD